MGLMHDEFFHSAKEKTARCADAAERALANPGAHDVQAESMKIIAFEAHAMKGSALTLCAKAVGARCARLELVANGRCQDPSPTGEDDPRRLVQDIGAKLDQLFAHVAEVERVDSFPLAEAAEKFSDAKELAPRIATLAVDACVAFQAALAGDADASDLCAAAAKNASALGAARLSSAAAETSRLCADGNLPLVPDSEDASTADVLGEYQFAVESFAWDAWQVLGASLPDVEARLRRSSIEGDEVGHPRALDRVEYATVRPSSEALERGRVAVIAKKLAARAIGSVHRSLGDGGGDGRSSMEMSHSAGAFGTSARSGNPCDFIRLVRNLGEDNQFAFGMLRGFVDEVDAFCRGVKSRDDGGDDFVVLLPDERAAAERLAETAEFLSSQNLGESLNSLTRLCSTPSRGGDALRRGVERVEDAGFELRSFSEGLARAQMATSGSASHTPRESRRSRVVSRVSRDDDDETPSGVKATKPAETDPAFPKSSPTSKDPSASGGDDARADSRAEDHTKGVEGGDSPGGDSPGGDAPGGDSPGGDAPGADADRRRRSDPHVLSSPVHQTPRRSDGAVDSAWFNAKYGGDVGERLREASWVLQQRRSSRVSKSSASTANSLRSSLDIVRESEETRGTAAAIANLAPRELREVLSRLNVPDKASEGLIVDLGEALTNSDGNWDFVLGCVTRYASLAREQFEVLKMLLNPRRCESKPVDRVITEALLASARSIAEGASVCCAPPLFSAFERMENVLVDIARNPDGKEDDRWNERVAHAIAASEHKLAAYETCVRSLFDVGTFSPRDLVTKTCGGDLSSSTERLRTFLRGAYGAHVLAADAFASCAEAHASARPEDKAEAVVAKLVRAKAALSASERRAAGICARGSVLGAIRRAVARIDLIARDFGADPESLASALSRDDARDDARDEEDSTAWATPPPRCSSPAPTYGAVTFSADRFRADAVAGLLDLKSQIERVAKDIHRIAPRDLPGDPTANPDAYLRASHDDAERVERRRTVAFKNATYPPKRAVDGAPDTADPFEEGTGFSEFDAGVKRVSAALVDGLWIRAFIGFFITFAAFRLAMKFSTMDLTPA